jgi:hypothetical protein
MKPSQNSLFKAATSVRSVAESRILGLVLGKYQWREIQWKSDLRRKKNADCYRAQQSPLICPYCQTLPLPASANRLIGERTDCPISLAGRCLCADCNAGETSAKIVSSAATHTGRLTAFSRCWPTSRVFSPQHSPPCAAHTVGCLVFSAPVHYRLLFLSFLQLLLGDRSPTVPSRQQAVDYTLLCLSVSAPHQSQRRLSVVVAAHSPPNLVSGIVFRADRRPFCFAGTVLA